VSEGQRIAGLPSEVLAAIAEATARLVEPEELFDVLRTQVARLVDCDAFYVALWDSTAGRIRFVAHWDRGVRLQAEDAPLGSGPTSWVIRHRQVLALGRPESRGVARGSWFGSAEPSRSAVHAPMLLGDRLIGVLSTHSYGEGAYDDEAIALIAAVAMHAAIAIEAARTAATTRAALAASETLRELAHDLSGIGTVDAAVERGLQAALAVAGAAGAMIAARPSEHHPGLVVLGALGSEARAHRVGDLLGDRDPRAVVARGGSGAGMVPMRFGSVITGVLTVSGEGPGWLPPGRDTLQVLQAIGDQVASAIGGLRLRGELLTRLDQLDALGRVTHALTGVEDADRTTQYLLEEGMRVFRAERGGVFLLDREAGTAACLARVGLSREFAQAFERQFLSLPWARGLLAGQAVFAEQARRDLASPLAAAIQAEGFASATWLPLVFASEVIGLLAFVHDRPRDYADDERRLAVAFADQAALAIGKSRLFDLVNRGRRDWQTAFDAAATGLAILDPEGRIIRANLFLADLAGVPVTDLAGRAFRGLLSEQADPASDPISVSAQAGSAVTDVVETAGGRSLVITANPLPEGGHVVAVDDVSEVIRLDQRFRALFATAPVAIFTLDEGGVVRSLNPAARALGGFQEAAPRLADYLLPAERESVGKQWARVRTGEPREFVMRLRRPDGAVRETTVVAVQASGEASPEPMVLAIARDLTDEHRLREQLGHSEKLAGLGRLVSGVAHELNNPLAGISALAQALILDEPLDEGSRRVVESIRTEASRAAQIVTDLLTFARQRPLRRTELQLGDLVREAITGAAGRFGVWETDLPADLPAVHADPDQVRQVVVNLMANAAHAMRETGGTGRLRAWTEGAAVVMEVADEGPGIPPEVMPRIFEPFFTTKGEGTGLGLAISHGIVRAHGGDIHAQNRPGGGARIWFELPRHPGRASR